MPQRRHASEAIAEFAANFDGTRIGAEHVRLCGRALADTFAVAVAGLKEESVTRVRRYVDGLASGSVRHSARGGTVASLWGNFATAATLEGAALANGVAAHVLDFDDASSPMSGHPSSALFPALIALGVARGVSGSRLIEAYLIGFEICCRLGRALDPVHYTRGWHMTASVGTVAAAVACSYLIGLNGGRIAHAIGLAVAQTGGSRENFGTDAKAFQVGQCNAAALRATLLAEQGFTSAITALDGKAGYTRLYSNAEDLSAALEGLGERPLEIERSGIEVKKYPACYAVHRPLDGVFHLMRTRDVRFDDVEGVDIQTSQGALALLIPGIPRSGMESKFSMSYAIAAATADRKIGLSTFTDEAVRRPYIRKFMSRVVSRESNGNMVPRFAVISIRLKSGNVVSHRVDALHGSPTSPLSDREFLDKIEDCLSWAHSPIDGESILELTKDIRKSDVRELVADLMAPTRSGRAADGSAL
jgi:2-methylcitrate dehydratase PrpD